MTHLHFHQLLGLKLNLLALSICLLGLILSLNECFVLLGQHLIVLHQGTLVHDLQLVLILLILLLHIIHGLLICLRQQTYFFVIRDLQLLLHLVEGLNVDLSWCGASGHVLTV